MTRLQTAPIVAALCIICATVPGRAAEDAPVVTEFGVRVKMRDGVTLRADIYRPNADGQYPVLLQRTPYDKDGDKSFGLKAAARGYVVIIQDVRGRYTSEGEWYTFKHEPDDGYDTVEWAAALPYSNGKVGMFGGSYVGATQMLAAIARPPHLAGICPVVTASNYHSNWTYQGGAFEQWFNQSWTSGLAQDTFARSIGPRSDATKGMWELPLDTFPLFNPPADGRTPDSLQNLAPYYLDWLAHPSYDDYWKKLSIEEHFGDIQVPMLTIAAWYDIFQDGSLRNYVGVKAQGRQRRRSSRPAPPRHCRGPCGERAEDRRRRFRAGVVLRRRRDHTVLVRLPVQGRAERVRGKAREDFRDGRKPVAR